MKKVYLAKVTLPEIFCVDDSIIDEGTNLEEVALEALLYSISKGALYEDVAEVDLTLVEDEGDLENTINWYNGIVNEVKLNEGSLVFDQIDVCMDEYDSLDDFINHHNKASNIKKHLEYLGWELDDEFEQDLNSALKNVEEE